ncbi:unnamed protein product, partial [Ectocarpus sp. 12 AP-2014]
SIYENISEKGLKQDLAVYGGLAISAFILPILMIAFQYFLFGKISFSKIFFIFLVILLWSLFNIDYLQKRIKPKGKSE